MKRLLLGLILWVPLVSLAVDCDEIWKQCWAHCQLDDDPLACYDHCMAFYGCRDHSVAERSLPKIENR